MPSSCCRKAEFLLFIIEKLILICYLLGPMDCSSHCFFYFLCGSGSPNGGAIGTYTGSNRMSSKPAAFYRANAGA